MPAGATNYIQVSTGSLQVGATFYVSSGTVANNLSVGGVFSATGTVTLGSVTMTNSSLSLSSGTLGSSIYNNSSSGASLTIDWSKGNTQYVSVNNNCSLTFTNGVSGRKYVLILNYTGSYTPTFPVTARFPRRRDAGLNVRERKRRIIWLSCTTTSPQVRHNLAETLNY